MKEDRVVCSVDKRFWWISVRGKWEGLVVGGGLPLYKSGAHKSLSSRS